MKAWLFTGRCGGKALCRNKRGDRLPKRLGPWVLLSPASFDDTADSSLTALRSIEAKGYFILGYADPELVLPQQRAGAAAGLRASIRAPKRMALEFGNWRPVT